MEFEGNDKKSKEYEVKVIYNSKVHATKSDRDHLLGVYYLVLWKNYPKKENT